MASVSSPASPTAAYQNAASPVDVHGAAPASANDPTPSKKRPMLTPATFAVVRASDRQQQRRLLRQAAPLELPEPERTNDWASPLLGCCEFPAHFLVALLVPWVNGAYVAHAMSKPGLLVGVFLLVAYVGTLVSLPGSQQDDGSWHFFASDVKTPEDYRPSGTPAVTAWDVVMLFCAVSFMAGVGLLRAATREFYDIRGWSFQDCCAALWCPCCALAQMSVHTQREKAQYNGDGDGQGDGDAATLPAFIVA